MGVGEAGSVQMRDWEDQDFINVPLISRLGDNEHREHVLSKAKSYEYSVSDNYCIISSSFLEYSVYYCKYLTVMMHNLLVRKLPASPLLEVVYSDLPF